MPEKILKKFYFPIDFVLSFFDNIIYIMTTLFDKRILARKRGVLCVIDLERGQLVEKLCAPTDIREQREVVSHMPDPPEQPTQSESLPLPSSLILPTLAVRDSHSEALTCDDALELFLLKGKTNMKLIDLKNEKWRSYEWIDPVSGQKMTHRITAPDCLTVGRTTHRVKDITGLVHVVPNVGYFGCVLYWENKPKDTTQQLQEHSCLKD
jgi:hypothetical protein